MINNNMCLTRLSDAHSKFNFAQQGVFTYNQEYSTIMEWTMGVDNVTVQ